MNNKLYVGNVPFNASEEELQDFFGSVGSVSSVKVIRDRDTGRSKGFAFVEMESDNLAQDALSLDGSEFLQRNLKVSIARERESRGPRGGGGGFRPRNF
ncbi:MAG: RNA-binding protein [Bdellovibrionales bacterium]|nr:RNA-binding protein [Bdellovibrionales bacterium]